jgi:UDP-glucose:(heptosyl)LPS alpha-1,3-glucosyltransferase
LDIALAIDHLDVGKGGAERWLARVLAGLAARGHELHLVAMSWSGPLPEAVRRHRIAVPRLLPRALRDAAFAGATGALLERLSPDVSVGVRHVPSVDVFLALGGLHREALRGSLRAGAGPWRRLSYRFRPKHRILLDLERRLLARPDPPLVIAPSEMVKAHCEEACRLLHDPAPGPDLRVAVIPHGVDLDRFRPLEPALRAAARERLGIDGRFTALFAAHNFRLKGLPALLEAWRGLDPSRFLLLVAGRGKAPAGATRAGNVRFLGHRDDLADLYRAADALVHPTFYDPFPLVVLEALASGLPVITTRWNGAASILTEGREGFVIDDPWRAHDLRDRIERLAEPEGAAARSAAARRLAEMYPEEVFLERTLDAIEEEGRSKRAAPVFCRPRPRRGVP